MTRHARAGVARACSALSQMELDELEGQVEGGVLRFRSPFASALVASALEAVPDGGAQALRRDRGRWLLECMERPGLWHFSREVFPGLPLDADDSSCALAAVHALDGSFARAVDFHAALDVLLAHARRDGGCRTWLVGWETAGLPRGENEVDVVVNANVLHLASRLGRWLPSVERHVADHVLSHGLTCTRASHYYESPSAFAYFLARWLGRAGVRAPSMLLACVRSELHGLIDPAPADPLDAAFTLNALLDLRPSFRAATRIVSALVEQQDAEGGWPARPFFLGPARSAFGSAALTTAFCAEALAKYGARYG